MPQASAKYGTRAVMRGQQGRAAEWRCAGIVAVEHGVDLLGGGGVGGGKQVEAERRDAKEAAFLRGNGEDGMAGVLLLRGAVGLKVMR